MVRPKAWKSAFWRFSFGWLGNRISRRISGCCKYDSPYDDDQPPNRNGDFPKDVTLAVPLYWVIKKIGRRRRWRWFILAGAAALVSVGEITIVALFSHLFDTIPALRKRKISNFFT